MDCLVWKHFQVLLLRKHLISIGHSGKTRLAARNRWATKYEAWLQHPGHKQILRAIFFALKTPLDFSGVLTLDDRSPSQSPGGRLSPRL